jgi:hypothetical protein
MIYDERMRNARGAACAGQCERPPPIETHSHHSFIWMRGETTNQNLSESFQLLALGLYAKAKG